MTIKENKPNNQSLVQILQGNEILKKFYENQQAEISIKAKGLEIEKQKNNNEFEYAKLALEKQFEITKYAMEHQRKNQKGVYWMSVFFAILIGAVIVFAMSTNHVDIAMRILEIVATALISGFGGYHAGKNKKERASLNQANQHSQKQQMP